MERLPKNKLGASINIRLGFTWNALKVLDSSDWKELVVKTRDRLWNNKRWSHESFERTKRIADKRMVTMEVYFGESIGGDEGE